MIAALALGLVLLPAAPPLSAGPEKGAFPSGDQRSVLYGDVNRQDIKQVRRLFAAPETARGARAGAMRPGPTTGASRSGTGTAAWSAAT